MPTCPHCGHASDTPTSFCAGCGARLSTEPATPELSETQPIAAAGRASGGFHAPTPTRPLPPPPDPATSPRSGRTAPEVDWMRVLRGNWLGAARVAVVTVGVAGLLSTALTALAKPTDFGLDNSLTLVATVLNATFGASLVARFHAGGETLHGSVGAVPLTVTILALGAGLIAFRRMIRDYRRAVDAVADAARAAVMCAVALTVAALVFRADSQEFGRGWGTLLAHLFDVRIAYGPSIPGSFVAGFVTVFLTLLTAIGVRRDLWPERRRHLSEFLVPPLYGLGAFVLMLPIAGLLGLVLMLVTGDTVQDADPTRHDFFASAAMIFGLLASGGYWLLNLGLGGTLGSHGTDGETSTSDYHHLGYAAQQDAGLWAAPAIALGVILVATIVVARRARTQDAVQASLLGWVGLLLVTTPVFVWLTSIRGKVVAPEGHASGAEGVNGWWAALLIPLAALVCSILVAHSRSALDISRLRQVGRDLQSDPGHRPADQA